MDKKKLLKLLRDSDAHLTNAMTLLIDASGRIEEVAEFLRVKKKSRPNNN